MKPEPGRGRRCPGAGAALKPDDVEAARPEQAGELADAGPEIQNSRARRCQPRGQSSQPDHAADVETISTARSALPPAA